MAEKIRFGVAGLGRVGWAFHCDRIGSNENCVLAAVADMDAARRAEAEEKYGCKAFADFNDMISSGLIDVAVIATPTHLHEQMAFAAFDKGLHVILEKPMAPTLDAAERIAAAAKKAGKLLTIYQPHRLFAYFQHIKKIVESGKIGHVTMIQRACLNYSRRNDWQSLKKYGGGMLNNYGAHFVDQVLSLAGYDVDRIFCALQLAATLGDADDVVKLTMTMKSGVIADIFISQATVAVPYEFVVHGSCGSVELVDGKLKIRYFDPSALAAKSLDDTLMSAGRKYPSDNLNLQEEIVDIDQSLAINLYDDFVNAIRTNGTPYIPVDQTLAVMRVLAECHKNAGQELDVRG